MQNSWAPEPRCHWGARCGAPDHITEGAEEAKEETQMARQGSVASTLTRDKDTKGPHVPPCWPRALAMAVEHGGLGSLGTARAPMPAGTQLAKINTRNLG